VTELEKQLYEALGLASAWVNIPEVYRALAEYNRQQDEQRAQQQKQKY
jgi:hypothetical protein